ncbi:MAG: TMEM165/GDT1 family protein [Xanthomonadales bacterium]|nr:TMEM165/GDT1 family protein [Xanthomonadales bacterium]
MSEWTAFLPAFALIALAELGDKSQLVCMTLAARYRGWAVLLGASLAFALLNVLAVLFGAAVSAWLPGQVTAGIAALLFALFGFHALLAPAAGDGTAATRPGGRNAFISAFLLILAAEFGDKTQLAVAGLAGTLPPVPVWFGATAALVLLSALGIWIGRRLFQRLSLTWIHRASGVLFLLFSGLLAWRALS